MRIKMLASCAKDEGNLTLLDEINEEGMVARQYVLLPGKAIFPLDGMPLLNEETLLTILDVPADKRCMYNVVRAPMGVLYKMMMEDAKGTDIAMMRGLWSIGMNGVTVTPVFDWEESSNVWFVENDLLKVLADERGVELARRTVDGSVMLLAMAGLKTLACFRPTVTHWRKEEAKQLVVAGLEAQRVYERFCDAENSKEADR